MLIKKADNNHYGWLIFAVGVREMIIKHIIIVSSPCAVIEVSDQDPECYLCDKMQRLRYLY